MLQEMTMLNQQQMDLGIVVVVVAEGVDIEEISITDVVVEIEEDQEEVVVVDLASIEEVVDSKIM